jgi:transposase-like protein
MKMVDTKSGVPLRVRVNRTGRRTYSREYKLEVVEECSAPGVSVAAVALSRRINANLVRRWIVRHRNGRLVRGPSAPPALLPVTLSAPSARSDVAPPGVKHPAVGVIEIELEAGRIRVRGVVDATALRTVLEVLAKR